uniref:L1 transposable element RRM domain-containing protein n=1 Tax=Molossus molossus TaxID=27622 RepID=A0A7J8HCH6_MOLMO|nr:hypothetical protein HJG59_011148 [Molossus molossus]
MKCNNTHIIGVPEGEVSEQGIVNLFKEMMTEKFLNPVKKKVMQVQETERVPIKMNTKTLTSRHIIIKMENIKDKERISALVDLVWQLDCRPMDQRVTSSILVKGTYLSCSSIPGYGWGCAGGNQSMCLSHINVPPHPSLPLYLKINGKIPFGEDLKK